MLFDILFQPFYWPTFSHWITNSVNCGRASHTNEKQGTAALFASQKPGCLLWFQTQPSSSDRTKELTGKSRGEGVCFYINNLWCDERNIHSIKSFCSPYLEFHTLLCRPFWCYGFQFPGFLHLSITSAFSRVLAQCILPSSMLHLRCDCLPPVLYQRSLPSLYLLHSPCRLCEVLPLYVCMSERFSFYSVYLLSLTHAELTLSICLQPALRPPARSGF